MMNQTLEGLQSSFAGKRISFVSGHFRTIHAGHIRLLRFAKEMADVLIVGVLPKDSFNARFPEDDRLSNVRSLEMVDHAFLMHSLTETLYALRPDFVVKGTEHKAKHNPESSIIETFGGKMVFTAGAIMASQEDEIASLSKRSLSLRQFPAFLERHNISKQGLDDLCEKMQTIRVAVIGDSIVDLYTNCVALGMSQEDPTIVVSPVEKKYYLGGAGIVAAHAAGLGAKVQFITVCGEDDAARYVRDKAQEYSLTAHIVTDNTRPTTLKERFRCKEKTLLRVSHLQQRAVDAYLCRSILDYFRSIVSDIDLLIFSDFNYGCLPKILVDSITQLAVECKVLITADSQSSSQIGDISRFYNATLLTPTEREARLAVHDFESGLAVLADKLLKKARASHVCMTLGEAGVYVQSKSSAPDQLPAFNATPQDVAGAGDSLLVCASLALAAGANIWQASYLGSLAAAIQVSRVGNIPLQLLDLSSTSDAIFFGD